MKLENISICEKCGRADGHWLETHHFNEVFFFILVALMAAVLGFVVPEMNTAILIVLSIALSIAVNVVLYRLVAPRLLPKWHCRYCGQ